MSALRSLERSWQQRRNAWWLRRCLSVGDGCRLEALPTLMFAADARVTIGRNFYFSSTPENSHMSVGPGAELRIGNDVWIGHGSSLSATGSVVIGDGTKLGPFLVLMDSDFHVAGDRSAAPETAPIAVGRGVFVGSGVTILRGVTIGDGAHIEPGAVVSGAVPANARVAGVPARALADRASSGSADDVSNVVKRALGSSMTLGPDDGPRTVPGWDSLGSLKVLLALEDEFEITLREQELSKMQTLRDIALLVERAREHRDAAPQFH